MSTQISDPASIQFGNEFIRPLNDRHVALYVTAKKVLAWWASKNLAATIPNDATFVLNDGSGSGSDARTPLTGADINGYVADCQAVVTEFEANANANLLRRTKAAVNPNNYVISAG